MRPVPLTNLTQGINHLRVKGAADPGSLYDLLNAFINQEGSVRPRAGTTRIASIPSGGVYTQGLGSFTGAGAPSNPGSSYTSGTYTNVPLQGGSGSGAIGTITVASAGNAATYGVLNGQVGQVLITAAGSGYVVGDSLTAGTAIATHGTIVGGSAYTNGTYSGVALTGGHGEGATANITVSGNAVTAVTIVSGGWGYNVGDAISAPASSLGGTGSGFSFPVATISAGSGLSINVAAVQETAGLTYFEGSLHVFSQVYGTLSAPLFLDVLAHPSNPLLTIETIWFSKPFMGFLYVVPQFSNGDIFHYWLQSSGEWDNNTVYQASTIVTPQTSNGLAYQAERVLPQNPTWSPNLVIATASYNGILTLGTLTAGTGYTNGTYLNSPLTIKSGTAGTGATADIVVSGGAVASVTLRMPGTGYSTSTVFTSASLGGGSNFQITVTAVGPGINILVPMIEPTVANGYYYVPTVYEFAPATSGTTLYIATGATEPTWPTSTGALIEDAGDYLQYTNSQLEDLGGSPSNILNTQITDRYGESDSVAGLAQTSSVINTSVLPLVTGALTQWKAGGIYQYGAIVTPPNNQGAYVDAVFNGNFYQNGGFSTTGWSLNSAGSGTNWAAENAPGSWTGGSNFGVIYNPGGVNAQTSQVVSQSSTEYGAVTPGQSVTATCYYQYSSNDNEFTLSFNLNWYNASNTLISTVTTTASGTNQGWIKISVSGSAPANAAFAGLSFTAGCSYSGGRGTAAVTNVQWNLQQASAATQLIYQCTAVGTYNSGNPPPAGIIAQGTSGTKPPQWPTNVGGTVVDGQLTWTAVGSSIITWTAFPIMESSNVQPAFPTVPGQSVWDGDTTPLALNGLSTGAAPPYAPSEIQGVQLWKGGFVWQCISRQITDPNCPNTNIVALGASHVFVGDTDIVAFSAAVNPTDFTSSNNAGYLPTGLQNYGDNPVAVLGLYRSNLMVWNSGGYQMWQIDPDPSNMALLDAQPIGSTYTLASQTVSTDNLILTPVGIRNVGMTGATVNMQTGMSGQPIDDLVQAQIQAAQYTPFSLYFPARGQYWCIFGPQAFVSTTNKPGQFLWSRYLFPDALTNWTLWGDELYLRTANSLVWHFDITKIADDVVTGNLAVTTVVPSGGFADTLDDASGTMVTPQAVTFAEYQSQSLPFPLVTGTTYYVRSISGSYPSEQIIGIAATPTGATFSDYEAGNAVMNWNYTANETISSVAGTAGNITYTGANPSWGSSTALTFNNNNIVPNDAVVYYPVNFSYSGGVLTAQLATSIGGSPVSLSAGSSNASWSIATNVPVSSVTIATGGYITLTQIPFNGSDLLPNGSSIKFTGSPPSPLNTSNTYTLQQLGGANYTVQLSGVSQILTTTGGSFNTVMQGGSTQSSTDSTTVNIGGTYYIPTNIPVTTPLAGYKVAISNGTGYSPYPLAAGNTYTIGTAVNNGGNWAITCSGNTLKSLAYNTLDGATITDCYLTQTLGVYNLVLIVSGNVPQTYFGDFCWDIGGASQQFLSSNSATYTYNSGNNTSTWVWATSVTGPTSGTMNVTCTAQFSPMGEVYWQAALTVQHVQVTRARGQVFDYWGYSTSEGGGIGSLAAITYGWSISNANNSLSSTATLGTPYGWLYCNTTGLTVNETCTVTSTGSLPSPLAGATTYYLVTVDTANGRVQLSGSPSGTPIQLNSAGSGTINIVTAAQTSIAVTGIAGVNGYLNVPGGALTIGTQIEITGVNVPTPLAANTPYYVIDAVGAFGMHISSSPGGAAINITSATSNVNMQWQASASAHLVTTAGASPYIELGNSSIIPVVGEVVQFAANGGTSPVTYGFALNTNYTIESVESIGLGTYAIEVSLGGSTVFPTSGSGASTFFMETASAGSQVPFTSIIWWPWLDCGDLGVNKEFVAFDIVGTGDAQVSFGWDQTDLTAFTPLYDLGLADSIPGYPFGIGLTAPSISPYIQFVGPQAWTLEAFVLYVNDLGVA